MYIRNTETVNYSFRRTQEERRFGPILNCLAIYRLRFSCGHKAGNEDGIIDQVERFVSALGNSFTQRSPGDVSFTTRCSRRNWSSTLIPKILFTDLYYLRRWLNI